MLPILNARDFLGYADGGTTRPLNIMVHENNSLCSYIAKPFSIKDINQKNYILRECFGNYLAEQFELMTPSAAFIQLDESFMDCLSKEVKHDITSRYSDVIFGTKHIGSGSLMYTPSLHHRYFNEDEVETIYAFDQMIFNVDRTARKPNMLYRDRLIYLIDHERSWGFNVPKMSVSSSIYKYHIFYDLLRERRHDPNIFDTFSYYMSELNIDNFDNCALYLEEMEMDVSDYEIWKDYLNEIKRNIPTFVGLLQKSLL